MNFVFWIGIGHAGTLISAVLCLLKQKWRTSINPTSSDDCVRCLVCWNFSAFPCWSSVVCLVVISFTQF